MVCDYLHKHYIYKLYMEISWNKVFYFKLSSIISQN